MKQEIVAELREQFKRQWKTLRDLVVDLPDDQSMTGELIHLMPGRLIYYILAGAEVYARSSTYEEYKSHQIFFLDWQVAASEELPSRQKAITHIEEMEKSANGWLDSMGDEGLLSTNEGFEWNGSKKDWSSRVLAATYTESYWGNQFRIETTWTEQREVGLRVRNAFIRAPQNKSLELSP